MTFKTLGVSPEIAASLEEKGITIPTDIQNQSIPYLLQGVGDYIGLAQTGTGKTFAFGIPLLELIDPEIKHTQSIVVAPTRELAQQISQDLKNILSKDWQINIETVFGGTSVAMQIKDIKRKNPHIIVGTPGRIIDLLKRKAIRINLVRRVVLDEADEMLNMGFKEDIYEILSYTPEDKQVWLFSATMPKEIRKIATSFMRDPYEVKINSGDRVNPNIEHRYAVLRRENKKKALIRFVESTEDMHGIVFCRTRIDTQRLADELQAINYKVESLHGDLSQQQRDRVTKKFKERKINLLIATDVAARGLDVDDLTHVIHHSLPDDKDYYTHRSGRTARAGKKGISLVLVTQGEVRKLTQIEKELKINFAQVKVPGIDDIRENKLKSFVDELLTQKINPDIQRGVFAKAEQELAFLSKEELIKGILSKELSTYLNQDSEDLNVSHSREEKMALKNFKGDRFFINVGKKDRMDRKELVSLISKTTGLDHKFIGVIDMDRLHSFFEVDHKHSKNVSNSFKNKKLKNRPLRVNRHAKKS